MARLLMDQCDAREAVAAMESMCQRRAQQLWREVPQAIHRPARYMHLQTLAKEFEAQAATWHLVWCLYCNEQPLGGTGGPEVLCAGGARTARQVLADALLSDPALSRCAAVVAWLESLADDALGGEEEGGGPRFASHEGVWLETQQRVGQVGVVTELDPDAPARQHAGLHPDNAAAEERLLARCWQLVRAGRHADAQALCAACGQPWRAASLSGPCGQWGPLPVGVAAARMEEDMTPDVQAEDMAGAVEMGGPAAPRGLWRWACLQAALQAAASPLPGGKYEAGLYGLLANHLPSVLPLCGSWRDMCWAYCRTWLEHAADRELAGDHESRANNLAIMPLGGEEVVVDVVAHFTGTTAKAQTLLGSALSAAAGGLPLSGTGADGSAAGGAAPRSFPAVFGALRNSAMPAVAVAAQDPLCQVQQLLIQDAMSELTSHLYSWLVNQGDATSAHNSNAAAEEGDGSLGLPPRPARATLFGAHLLLALQALGVLYSAPHGQEATLSTTQVRGLSEQVVGLYAAQLMERGAVTLVPQYLCHVREPLRTPLAYELLATLTRQLVGIAPVAPGARADPGSKDVRCLLTHACLVRWCGHCVERQAVQAAAADDPDAPPQALQLPDGAQLPRSFLHTSVRPEEVRVLVGGFLEGVRVCTLTAPSAADGSSASGAPTPGVPVAPSAIAARGVGATPLGRAKAARWLFYLHEARQGSASAAPLVGLPLCPADDAPTDEESELSTGGDPAGVLDGLERATALLQELVLGGAVGGLDAAAHLLDVVVPAGFSGAVATTQDRLQHQAGLAQARAAALQAPDGPSRASADVAQEAAAALDEAQQCAELAARLSSLSAELQAWRVYVRVEQAVQEWRAAFAARQQGTAGPGGDADRTALLSQGRSLLDTLQRDLLAQPWMAGVLDPEGSDALPEQEPASLILVITQAPSTSPRFGNNGQLPYPVLKGSALASLAQQLGSGLVTAATSAGGHVGVSVSVPPTAEGHVTVELAVGQATPQSTAALLQLGAGLLQGSLPGVPQVLAVNLCAPRALSLPLSARCCLAQAVTQCAVLRQGVTVLGGDGSDGVGLPELLAQSPVAPGVAALATPGAGVLADVLSPQQVSQVLQAEAETVVCLMGSRAGGTSGMQV